MFKPTNIAGTLGLFFERVELTLPIGSVTLSVFLTGSPRPLGPNYLDPNPIRLAELTQLAQKKK